MKAVVKISFYCFFSQGSLGFCFGFASTMFLHFFLVYMLVFSSDLTFLCKHVHAHTFIHESEIKCQ